MEGNEPTVPNGGEPAAGAAAGAAGAEGGAAAAPSATEWIPENLRAHKSLAKFKSPADVANAYVNLESAFGKRFDDAFKDDAPADVKARVRAAMGVPDSPDGYEAPKPPEGASLDENLIGSFKKFAHENGMPKGQAEKLMQWYLGLEEQKATEWQAASARAKEEGMKALRAQWGGATDQNLGLVHQVVAEFGDADLKAALDESGAGNDPRVLRFLAKIGKAMAEDNLIEPRQLGTSADDAKAKIAEIKTAAMKDRKHPYVNRDHPEHKSVLAEMSRLHEIAYGDV